jgi:hypothetical protein
MKDLHEHIKKNLENSHKSVGYHDTHMKHDLPTWFYKFEEDLSKKEGSGVEDARAFSKQIIAERNLWHGRMDY